VYRKVTGRLRLTLFLRIMAEVLLKRVEGLAVNSVAGFELPHLQVIAYK